MRKASLVAGAIGMACMFWLTRQAAWAADANFCNHYARAAISQVQSGLATPACVGGMKGTQWSPNYFTHYHWCLTATYEVAKHNRMLRTTYLKACRPQ
jgi:hypothetical protein